MLTEIGVGNRRGVINDGFGAVWKPAIKPAVKRNRGEYCNQNSRYRSDDGEQRDQPAMQFCPGALGAARPINRNKLPPNDKNQTCNNENICWKQRPDDDRTWTKRRQIWQYEIGKNPGHKAKNGENNGRIPNNSAETEAGAFVKAGAHARD